MCTLLDGSSMQRPQSRSTLAKTVAQGVGRQPNPADVLIPVGNLPDERAVND